MRGGNNKKDSPKPARRKTFGAKKIGGANCYEPQKGNKSGVVAKEGKRTKRFGEKSPSVKREQETKKPKGSVSKQGVGVHRNQMFRGTKRKPNKARGCGGGGRGRAQGQRKVDGGRGREGVPLNTKARHGDNQAGKRLGKKTSLSTPKAKKRRRGGALLKGGKSLRGTIISVNVDGPGNSNSKQEGVRHARVGHLV